MTTATFKTKAERDAHLAEYRRLKRVHGQLYRELRKLSWESEERPPQRKRVKEAETLYKQALEDYYDLLPVFTLAVCPICGAPYQHRIDPFGFDGPWWSNVKNGGIQNCAHAKLIRSAYRGVELMELKHDESSDFRLGPEVPYVIARILEMDSMVCVVSRTKISDNDDLFAMVYFSALEVERLDLTMSWDAENRGAWSHDSDRWDFDLKPWVENGKLRYCVPGEEPLRLGDTDVASFPFLEEPGYPARRFVAGGDKSGPHPFVPGHKIYAASLPGRNNLAPHHDPEAPSYSDYLIPLEENGDA